MIDTIKILIPIQDSTVLQNLEGKLMRFRREDLRSGEVFFEFYKTDLELGSYERNVSIKSSNNPQGLFIEFSVPKYAKGNNVEMIHPVDIKKYFQTLYTELCGHLRYDLPHADKWIVYRLDICYNWRFESYNEAQSVLNFIKLIDFPRKKKFTWDTSIMYKGSAYNVKFYLKGDEFRVHDVKSIEAWKSFLLEIEADKIVRFEVGLRRKQLESFFCLEPVRIKNIADNEIIEESLQYYLKKVFRYINPESSGNAEIIRKLHSCFTRQKATRLYEFYQNYYYNEEIQNLYKQGGLNRSTIYRYKRDIKNAGIGFKAKYNKENTLLEKLVIPSENTRFDFLNEND